MSIQTPIKVLLVDDSQDSFENLQELMGKDEIFEYEIQWMDNYIKGIKYLSTEQFDICLVKYELKNNGGIEFLKYANLFDSTLPSVLLSEEHDPAAQAIADELEVTDYLAKSELTPVFFNRVMKHCMAIKQSERKLLELSYRDSLTGIPNRSLFQIRIKDALALSKRQETMVAVLFLNVDNFKDINDLMGYPAGDKLLVELAQRLLSATRESDIISRLGGDEFAVVATNISSEGDVIAVANRLLDSLLEPINIDSFDFKVSISIGIAICPNDGNTVEAIVKSGDEALYQAKAVNRGTYHFFNKEMQDRRKAAQKFEKDLHDSLRNNELFIQYQPVVDLASNRVIGAEALVRWRHPERGIVPPDEFISIAERTGFINELGTWVLHEACKLNAAWNRQYGLDLMVAVNVSLAQLKSNGFIEIVQDTVLETGIPYDNLTLEITESMIADNNLVVIDALSRLGEMGVHISVDDFGAGHSSLARLKNFPVNDLKIDRSLISNVADDQQDAAIAMAILTLARELNLDVIAEGIETEQQANFLKKHGCALGQGYYFSRPLLAEDFENAFLKSQTKIA